MKCISMTPDYGNQYSIFNQRVERKTMIQFPHSHIWCTAVLLCFDSGEPSPPSQYNDQCWWLMALIGQSKPDKLVAQKLISKLTLYNKVTHTWIKIWPAHAELVKFRFLHGRLKQFGHTEPLLQTFSTFST